MPRRGGRAAGKVACGPGPRARVAELPREGGQSAAFLGRHFTKLFMTPTQPLSVKFDPAMRERIKRISSLLDWPEGQFVNTSVEIMLALIDDRSHAHIHRSVYLAQQALDYEKTQFQLPSQAPRKKS
jgi:hypothetical protein